MFIINHIKYTVNNRIDKIFKNLITNDDSKEKAAVGHLWANLNKEKYAFVMVEKCTSDGMTLDRQLQQIIGIS